MTEETPGFDEQQPDVPSGAPSDDAEPQAAAPSPEEEAAPAGDTEQNAALVAQLDQARSALSERTGTSSASRPSSRTTAAVSSGTGQP